MNNEASSSKSRDLLSAREAITLTRKDSHSRSAVDSRRDHERVSIHWESRQGSHTASNTVASLSSAR